MAPQVSRISAFNESCTKRIVDDCCAEITCDDADANEEKGDELPSSNGKCFLLCYIVLINQIQHITGIRSMKSHHRFTNYP